jgi:hypothetical protein
MRIRALQTFTIALPNGMVVLNAAKGKVKANEAEIDDHIAQQYIDAGMAEPAKGKPAKDPLDHDGDGRKGGVAPAAEEATKDDASTQAAADDKADAKEDAAP